MFLSVFAPVVWLAPVVDVLSATSPFFRVKLLLNWHQVVTHTQRPAGEAAFPAWVSIWQPNAGKYFPSAEKNRYKQPD